MAAAPQPSISATDSIRSSPDFDTNGILEEITRNAQRATGASGAALVLSDGKIMSCRACSGELAPPLGTRLNTDSGFTATCVRTAEVVRCDDTATDPRIDGSSCVQLGIRSILAVPIFNGRNVAGVLEVLSHEPNKFSQRHATELRLLARLTETVANYVSRDDVSPDTLPGKSERNDSSRANDQAKLTCRSCRHPNPQGSQFCNQCGVVLFSFLGPLETTVVGSRAEDTLANADQGFKEICDIISGKAGPATWNEISERLLADQRDVPAQDKPRTAATEKTGKTEDAVVGPGTNRGANGVKPRLGTAVRRSLWL